MQQVKYLALSLKQPRLLLWNRFSPWPRNFHMLQVQQRKKEGGREEKEEGREEGRRETEENMLFNENL